jgi:hypothetical protein
VSRVSFSLHRLLEESCIQLAASLLDSTHRPTKTVLHLVVWYAGPGQNNNTTVDTDLEAGLSPLGAADTDDENQVINPFASNGEALNVYCKVRL